MPLQVDKFSIIPYQDLELNQHIDMLNVRNHLDVRQWMQNEDEIDLKAHLHFVQHLDQDKYYAVYKDHIFVGSVYFKKEDIGVYDWGCYLNPDMFGLGISMVYIMLNITSRCLTDITMLTAKNRKNNDNAISLNELLNFQIQDEDDEYIHWALPVSKELKQLSSLNFKDFKKHMINKWNKG